MAANLDGQLVVAISSRALFDFEEENLVFETGMTAEPPPGTKKDAAYMKLQLERLDVPAKPGVAFSLVKKLLAFNDAPESAGEAASPTAPAQRVEVVILSRNDPVSGMRVFRSAQHYGLKIERGTFNRGEAPWRYLKPLHANLFLSAHLSDVRDALAAGVPAAQVYPAFGARQRCASQRSAHRLRRRRGAVFRRSRARVPGPGPVRLPAA
jgi:5'-nucleotidase